MQCGDRAAWRARAGCWWHTNRAVLLIYRCRSTALFRRIPHYDHRLGGLHENHCHRDRRRPIARRRWCHRWILRSQINKPSSSGQSGGKARLRSRQAHPNLIEVRADVAEIGSRIDPLTDLKQIARKFRTASGTYLFLLETKSLPHSSTRLSERQCLQDADEAIEEAKTASMIAARMSSMPTRLSLSQKMTKSRAC
jgi:hypothetical protein